MSMTVVNPGSLSSVQDLGRMGWQESGFSPSGAADADALRYLNLLLSNEEGEAAVEMTLGGMTVTFGTDCVFAVTGADDGPKLNGSDVALYKAHAASAGDTLVFGFAKNGARTYFGVAGGFDVPLSMGSRSTGMKFSVGGYKGRRLQAGDVIGFRAPVRTLPNMAKRFLTPPEISKNVTLRAVPGPQDSLFSEEALDLFFSSVYKVTANADRMGIRLEGAPVTAEGGTDILSDATATGAVQIASGGQPIILMQDRQTTGGYAKIACVISADLPKAGQLLPGAEVSFEKVTVEEAQKILRDKAAAYRKAYDRLNKRRTLWQILTNR